MAPPSGKRRNYYDWEKLLEEERQRLQAEAAKEREHLRAEAAKEQEHLRAEAAKEREHLRAEAAKEQEQLRAEAAKHREQYQAAVNTNVLDLFAPGSSSNPNAGQNENLASRDQAVILHCIRYELLKRTKLLSRKRLQPYLLQEKAEIKK